MCTWEQEILGKAVLVALMFCNLVQQQPLRLASNVYSYDSPGAGFPALTLKLLPVNEPQQSESAPKACTQTGPPPPSLSLSLCPQTATLHKQ